MKKSILTFTILLLISTVVFSQKLSPIEAKIIAQVNAQLPQTEALLKKVVNINSGTLNKEGVREVGAIFRKEFDNLGFKTEWISLPDSLNRAGHLVAERKGTKGIKLFLIGHLDTVFEKAMSFTPYTYLNDSTVTGQGVNDMKGGVTGQINAVAVRAAQARSSELKHLQSLGLGLADIPSVQAYLDALMQRIQEGGPKPVKFAKVLIRPRYTYNAATTRSGFIVVDLGWLKSIDTEAELSALLAHEYGHIWLEHLGTKNDVGTMTHFATLGAAVFAAKTKSNNYWSVNLLSSGWSGALLPNWSRTQEYEADQFAVETTQAMGHAFVPSVRAFLDRIQAVEKLAVRATLPIQGVPGPNKPAAASSDDHPRIEERISRVQKLVENRPRVRPSARYNDGWRVARDSVIARASEEEYVLAGQYFEALGSGRMSEMNSVAQKLDKRSKPLRTAAAMTAVAWSLPMQDLGRRITLLKEATAAPDASFISFNMLAVLERDAAKEYERSTQTLQSALDRFDSPAQQLPEVIEFKRIVSEQIDGLPPAQRPMQLALFALQNSAGMIYLKAKCQLEPEVAEACDWASLNEPQKQVRLQAQKARDVATANKIEQKVKSLFGK